MAKSNRQGQRGQRGLPGPRGPRGEQGQIGHTGKTGGSGRRGARGPVGKTGPLGTFSPVDRAEILSHVQGQIDEVHHALTAQIKRLNGLRRDLDELRANVAALSDESR